MAKPPVSRGLAAKRRNEVRKLRATTLNAIGIATLGAGLIIPLVRDGVLLDLLSWRSLVWFLAATALHGIAAHLLSQIEDET